MAGNSAYLEHISFLDKMEIEPVKMEQVDQLKKEFFGVLDTIYNNSHKVYNDQKTKLEAAYNAEPLKYSFSDINIKLANTRNKLKQSSWEVARKYTRSYFNQIMDITGSEKVAYFAVNSTIKDFSDHSLDKYNNSLVVRPTALSGLVNNKNIERIKDRNTQNLIDATDKLAKVGNNEFLTAYVATLANITQQYDGNMKKAVEDIAMRLNCVDVPDKVITHKDCAKVFDHFNLKLENLR